MRISDWSSDVLFRSDFDDALDFMGWYISKTQRINGVSKWDAYGQYLNYHEGWTGYRNRSYERKAWLKRVAQQVKARPEKFGAQYRSWETELSRGGLICLFCGVAFALPGDRTPEWYRATYSHTSGGHQ